MSFNKKYRRLCLQAFFTRIFNLELDNPIEIQYVVDNMFRISLKQSGHAGSERGGRAVFFREKSFWNFLLTKATINTYFVPVYSDIAAILVRIVVEEAARLIVLFETCGAKGLSKSCGAWGDAPKLLSGGRVSYQ